MARHSYSISEDDKLMINVGYGKGDSIGSIMAKMANAPTRSVVECNAVSAYPSNAGSSRRSVSITDSPIKRRTRTVSVNARPITRRVDFTLCEMLQPHTHDLPWLTNPEDYRCAQCGRYCSDTFLDDSKICGYCRGCY